MARKHFDDQYGIPFSPHLSEGHKRVAIGAALAIPYMPPGATCILIQAITNDINYTLDGTTPSATVGFALRAGGDPTLIEITENMVLKFYGTNSNSVLQYCWGK